MESVSEWRPGKSEIVAPRRGPLAGTRNGLVQVAAVVAADLTNHDLCMPARALVVVSPRAVEGGSASGGFRARLFFRELPSFLIHLFYSACALIMV